MNERLKELAIKAQVEHCISHVRLQEFAELIVRQCASMARAFQSHEYDFTGDLELDEFMLKHFGFKE